MHRLFFGCNSLKYLDLSSFNTSKVKYMNSLFNGCSSLTSLDLSNFDTSQNTFFQWMFNGSSNLEYINIEKFSFEKLNNSNNMFDYIPDNVVICFKSNNTKYNNIIFNNLKNQKCFINYCSKDWKKNQKKLITNNNTINLINNISFFNICKCDLNNCLLYSNDNKDLNQNICNELNNQFYPKKNDTFNMNQINCYKDPFGYYLDTNFSLYKKCNNYYYIDENNKYQCTKEKNVLKNIIN